MLGWFDDAAKWLMSSTGEGSIWGEVGRSISSAFTGQVFFTIHLKDAKDTGIIGYGIGGISAAKEAELYSAKTTDQVTFDISKKDASIIIKLAKGQKKAYMNKVTIPVINILTTDEGPLPS